MLLGALGAAVPALAETSRFNNDTFLSCMQTAVGKREDAIISSTSTFSTALNQSLTNRKGDLLRAWQISDQAQRETARKLAWKTFQDSVSTARTTFKASKTSTWDTFRTDRKVCGAPITDTSDAEVSL